VSDSSPLLDRAAIEEAFRLLGERLAKRDVDALFKPHGIVLEEALAVAAELGLPRWGPGSLPGVRSPGSSRLRCLP
jgi:hypothetical protein